MYVYRETRLNNIISAVTVSITSLSKISLLLRHCEMISKARNIPLHRDSRNDTKIQKGCYNTCNLGEKKKKVLCRFIKHNKCYHMVSAYRSLLFRANMWEGWRKESKKETLPFEGKFSSCQRHLYAYCRTFSGYFS
jgi:hypothetical protein